MGGYQVEVLEMAGAWPPQEGKGARPGDWLSPPPASRAHPEDLPLSTQPPRSCPHRPDAVVLGRDTPLHPPALGRFPQELQGSWPKAVPRTRSVRPSLLHTAFTPTRDSGRDLALAPEHCGAVSCTEPWSCWNLCCLGRGEALGEPHTCHRTVRWPHLVHFWGVFWGGLCDLIFFFAEIIAF